MRPCPSCGGDCGYTKKKGCQYKSNEFNPDWDEVKDMVEENQRLAKRVEELEQRTWVGLTDEEIQECLKGLPTQTIVVYARRIEAKLKDKNT